VLIIDNIKKSWNEQSPTMENPVVDFFFKQKKIKYKIKRTRYRDWRDIKPDLGLTQTGIYHVITNQAEPP